LLLLPLMGDRVDAPAATTPGTARICSRRFWTNGARLRVENVQAGEIHVGDEHAVLLEARIARHQILQAAREEQCAGEQHNRKRHLCRYQNTLQTRPLTARAHPASTGFEN
jgi:hypothetical protein